MESDFDPTSSLFEIKDEDRYSISSESTVYLLSTDDEEGEDVANTSKIKKRKYQPETWKKNIRKKQRNLGQEYYNSKNVLIPARKMRPGCLRQKCKFKCRTISEAKREAIFKEFWALGDVQLQWTYISNLLSPLEESNTYRRLLSGGSVRACNNAYHFDIDGRRIRVCKFFFMATFDIGNKFMCNLQKKLQNGDQRGKHDNRKTIPEALAKSIRLHIASIPRLESQYLGKQHPARKYISDEKTLSDLHRDYVAMCKNKGKPFANYTAYRNIFLKENICFFSPSKKDQRCATCDLFSTALEKDTEISQEHAEIYEAHNREFELSEEEKNRDIELGETGTCITACLHELQALPTPYGGDISLMYYKKRLSTYNFTIYDMTNRTRHCYSWHEGIANCGPNEIGSCLHKFLKKAAIGKPIILYSDDNSEQNKNKYIVSLLLYMVHHYNIPSITMKYFTAGHTAENHVQTVVEKRKKQTSKTVPIYVPSQWVEIIREARKKSKPLMFNAVETKQILDLKKLCTQLGKNFNLTDENCKISWEDIKIIQVRKDDLFSFGIKTGYDELFFQNITIATCKTTETPATPKLLLAYPKGPPGISIVKKRDLLSLCNNNAVPEEFQDFYEKIPCKNQIQSENLDDDEEEDD